jgi:large subunit ribosomal protein L7e
VPESVLKKRKSLAELRAHRATKATEKAVKLKKARKIQFKRAEKYVKEYRQTENAVIRAKRQAKNGGNFYVPDEPKVAFVVRIRG